ncbi:hypothetical protein NEHOM01_0180 [Nematocida homosporus]|uniref:uncharacterized protein n=1 Tax=Nematocida homosporus TaxID=1912981 RepID=UPI00221E42C2|nr:uncharacterized protein NEHOM01_0180 [Nematocida homosporus]KAI5184505.1 hypothetical protein NEHOM01_0180 [Nematocida homosporus]
MGEIETYEKRLVELFAQESEETLAVYSKYIEIITDVIEKRVVVDEELETGIAKEKAVLAYGTRVFEELKERRFDREGLELLFKSVHESMQ